MVDFGMFQGRKEIRQRNWTDPEFPAPQMEAVIVTHTHLDHIGRLPRLVKNGFNVRVAKEIAEVMAQGAFGKKENETLSA